MTDLEQQCNEYRIYTPSAAAKPATNGSARFDGGINYVSGCY